MEEFGILDGKVIVFIEWVGDILMGVSDGEQTITVFKSRVEF